MRNWRWGAQNSLDSLFSSDLFFLLSPHFTHSVNQETPQLPSLSRADGAPTMLICPLTSGSASSPTFFPHGGNCKPIDTAWISCSWFWFLISEHLIYNSSAMQTHISNTTWALPHIPVKLVVCFTEASMAYYHFLELCLEFRPVGQSAASWTESCCGQQDFLAKAGKCLAELIPEHSMPYWWP